MRLPGSLRARLTLAALLAVAVGGAIAGVLLLAAVERDGRRAIDKELREQTAEVLRGPRGGPGRFGRGPRGGEPLLRGSGTFVQVSYGDEVVARQGDVPDAAPAPPDREGFSTVDIEGRSWRSLTILLGDPADTRFQAFSTLAPVEERVASIRRLILLIGLLALALTGLAAWVFSTLTVRPLARLQAGAARVTSAEDLSTPLPDEGPDEVRSLAGALNGMLARLQASTAATRRFAADAGHELRTPLTGLRANLDTLARNPDLPEAERAALLRESSAEQDRIVHLLEGLQALARGEAAEALPREDVELGDLVDAAIYGARRRHPGVSYELREHDAEGAAVHGWANGLRLVVDNLLENAALHGGGRVDVDLARENGRWLLRVADDGPGIPEAERERLLEPFARGRGTTAQGTGLGLAIVAQQVGLHGGELRLADSSMGGLAAEVRLPAGA
ncbi:MAG: HAMP domain-containing sensor histidine kinase [Solirubrobacteraceae bacterium]